MIAARPRAVRATKLITENDVLRESVSATVPGKLARSETKNAMVLEERIDTLRQNSYLRILAQMQTPRRAANTTLVYATTVQVFASQTMALKIPR